MSVGVPQMGGFLQINFMTAKNKFTNFCCILTECRYLFFFLNKKKMMLIIF